MKPKAGQMFREGRYLLSIRTVQIVRRISSKEINSDAVVVAGRPSSDASSCGARMAIFVSSLSKSRQTFCWTSGCFDHLRAPALLLPDLLCPSHLFYSDSRKCFYAWEKNNHCAYLVKCIITGQNITKCAYN